MLNPTAAAQRQGVLQPIPTPPPPAEALKCPARKPQNVSAFALTYILLRRSCKRMGAFIIHPCLPVSQRKCKQQGPFAPRTLLRFTAVGSEVAHRVSQMLATVRRSNRACSFPAHGFHEDSLFRDAIEGIN